MFAGLKQYQNIFVSGPNRSGTTICARMIAEDTGHDLVLEDEFTCSNLAQLSTFINADYGPQVIQCPFVAPVIHDLEWLIGADMNQAMVVFMHRFRGHIVRSEQNAETPFGGKVNFSGDKVLRQHNSTISQHASDATYDAWQDQCKAIPNAMDVAYESLRGHPLWDDNASEKPFEHTVKQGQLHPSHLDGLRALQNI